METTNKTSSEILLEAADLLEQEGRWGKNSFLSYDASVGCKMCAHGAIAFCGNPKIKKLVLKKELARARDEIANTHSPQLHQIDEYHIVRLAHYKATQVGLNFSYNDDIKTTKQDVINKLREAALL